MTPTSLIYKHNLCQYTCVLLVDLNSMKSHGRRAVSLERAAKSTERQWGWVQGPCFAFRELDTITFLSATDLHHRFPISIYLAIANQYFRSMSITFDKLNWLKPYHEDGIYRSTRYESREDIGTRRPQQLPSLRVPYQRAVENLHTPAMP